jgi:hypothetical protein
MLRHRNQTGVSSLPAAEFIETGGAALLWAAIFLWGGHTRSLYSTGADRPAITSFGAGMAVAYAFMHMMPELHEVRRTFASSVPIAIPYEGKATYLLALIGFLTFYGLRYLPERLRGTAGDDQAARAFWLHVTGFSAYIWLLGYLLVNSLHETESSIALYAVAMAVHFLAVDRAFRDEDGAAYQRTGRLVLAAMAIIGWAVGLVFVFPQHVLALLVAFLSGAIIMNSTVMELSSVAHGRFWPMMAGGALYGMILLVAG